MSESQRRQAHRTADVIPVDGSATGDGFRTRSVARPSGRTRHQRRRCSSGTKRPVQRTEGAGKDEPVHHTGAIRRRLKAAAVVSSISHHADGSSVRTAPGYPRAPRNEILFRGVEWVS